MSARTGETRRGTSVQWCCRRGSTPLHTVVSCATEPQPDPGAAGGTPEPRWFEAAKRPGPWIPESGPFERRKLPSAHRARKRAPPQGIGASPCTSSFGSMAGNATRGSIAGTGTVLIDAITRAQSNAGPMSHLPYDSGW